MIINFGAKIRIIFENNNFQLGIPKKTSQIFGILAEKYYLCTDFEKIEICEVHSTRY